MEHCLKTIRITQTESKINLYHLLTEPHAEALTSAYYYLHDPKVDCTTAF